MKQQNQEIEKGQRTLSLKENGVLSWRFVAVLSLMGCIAVEVLFNLMPIDHDTLLLFWFFPVSLLALSQLYVQLRFTKYVEVKLLLAFLLWGLATVVLNFRRAQMVDSYGWFACICAAVFLCFSLPYAFEKEAARRVLSWLAIATVLAVVLLSLMSIIAIYFKEIAQKAPSIFEGIEIWGGRLAIDIHPNRSAPAPALGVILSVYLFAATKKVWQRVFFVLCAVICFIPLALTASRTAILGAGLALSYMAFLALRSVLAGRMRPLLRYALCALAALAVCAGIYKGATLTARLSNDVIARMEAVSVQTAEDATSDEVVERDFSDAEDFNGRTDIWLGVWGGLVENPKILAFGTGPWMAPDVMAPYFPAEAPSGIFHNSLVGTLVAFGVIGLALALAFLVLAAGTALRLSFGKKHDQPLAIRLLPAVLLFAVAEGMMEDFLFAGTSFNITWIWFMIAAGFTFRLLKKDDAVAQKVEEPSV